MRNEFYQHQKSDTVKWVITFVVLILLATTVVALCANVYGGGNMFEPAPETDELPKETVEELETNAPEENESSEGVETIQIKDTQLLKMMATSYASGNGNGVQITVTPNPSDASLGELTWEMDWADPNSEMAFYGAKPEDFVTLEVDGNTAIITEKEAFRSQIKITVTSSLNSEAKAECLVDKGQKLDSHYISARNNNFFASGDIYPTQDIKLSTLTWGNAAEMAAKYRTNGVLTPYAAYSSNYTVGNEGEATTITVAVTPEFYAALQGKGIALDELKSYTFASDAFTAADILNSLSCGELIPNSAGQEADVTLINAFNNVVANYSGVGFTITAHVESTYDSRDFVYNVSFASETVNMPVSLNIAPGQVIL